MLVLALTLFLQAQEAKPSTPVDFQGVTLGSEISLLPECHAVNAGARAGISVWTYVAGVGQRPCWMAERPNLGLPAANSYKLELFPATENIVRGLTDRTLTIIDGKIESVVVRTSGLSAHSDVYARLQERFGRPTTAVDEPATTTLGMRTTRVMAEWIKPGFAVRYMSFVDRIDGGIISVSTEKADKAESDSSKSKRDATRL